MQPETARLKRLLRLERIRAIASRNAAREAAEAEGTLAQLKRLADRTEGMAQDYRGRGTPSTGQELRQLGAFLAGLEGIAQATAGDLDAARAQADGRQRELALAERRRAAVEDRARDQARAIGKARAPQEQTARRALGTALE